MSNNNEEPIQVGRIAVRGEGNNVNFYHAPAETMQGAVLLFSVRRALLRGQEDPVFKTFLSCARQIVSDNMKELLGARPTFDAPTPAPEHERAGSA